MLIRSRLDLGGLLCTVAFTSAPAFGAEAGSAETRSPDVTLGEVVVTAQKRSERLQDVPLSVAAIDAAPLVAQNALRLQDYLNDVPGTSVNDLGFGRTQVVIRGIATGIGNNPTTGFTIDDVPVGSSTTAGAGDLFVPNLDPSDLASIEVLRGPQGTLYGASSMGGLVKYVTADPETAVVSGQVGVDGSTVAHGGNAYGARAGVNVPLIEDVLAIRASGFYRQTAGFIDDPSHGTTDVNEGDAYGGRVAALWQIAPSVTLRLSALAQNHNGDASNTQDVNPNGTPLYDELTHARLLTTDGFSTKSRLYSANLSADLGWSTLTSISGYSQVDTSYPQDVSGNFQPFTPLFYGTSLPVKFTGHVRTNKFTQELRLASDNNQHLEWLVGAFYTRENGPTDVTIGPADAATGARLPLQVLSDGDTDSTYKEQAGFGNLTYYFTDRIDLTVGARYSSNEQESSTFQQGLLLGGRSTSAVYSSSGNATTFLLTPRFRISDSLMTYARIASGYRPGGFNSGAMLGSPTTFQEDETVNYELGVKGSALDQRLTYETAVFYIDWRDIQIRQIDLGTGSSYYTNAGKAKSRGVELSAQALPTARLTLGLNASYTDAHLTEPAPTGTYAPAGSQLPNSSKWSGSVSAEQEMRLTSNLDGFGSIKVSYMGERIGAFTRAASIPRFVLPSYTTIDLQLGAKTERWTAGLFVRNLTDELGFLAAQPLNSISGMGPQYASVIQPRTIGLSLSTQF